MPRRLFIRHHERLVSTTTISQHHHQQWALPAGWCATATLGVRYSHTRQQPQAGWWGQGLHRVAHAVLWLRPNPRPKTYYKVVLL